MGTQRTITELSQLQNVIKRDPEGYREEFELQYRHFQSLYSLIIVAPTTDTKHFEQLCMFVSHVVHVYKDRGAEFPQLLIELLEEHAGVMYPGTRRTVVKALVLCRNKGLVDPVVWLSTAFRLFRINDKVLRSSLSHHIVTDIKNMNKNRRNNKVNSALQSMLYGFLQDASKKAAKCALDVLIALYRKNVWIDAKTVNVIASACFVDDNIKMLVAALKFFVSDHDLDLGSAGDDEDESHIKKQDFTSVEEAKAHFQHSNKTKGRKRKLQRALKRLARDQAEAQGQVEVKEKKKYEPNFAAIELIYDGQSFGERLFSKLRRSKDRFEVRLLMMDMIARTIAAHELLIINFYPYMQRYMQPHQQHAILILSIVAQAIHPLVPEDVVLPVLQTLLYHFVTDRASADVMTVGLNAAREICRRHPDAITEDLLSDLVEYKGSKFKGVAMAARSLLQLYRNVRPDMLHRRLRGKEAAMALTAKKRKAREDANAITNDDGDSDNDGEVDDDGFDEVSSYDDESNNGDELTSLAAPAERMDRYILDKFRTRPKMNKQERLEWIRAGRSDPKAQMTHFRDRKESSSTNAEKKKTKNFVMMQQRAKRAPVLSIEERNKKMRRHRRALKRRKKK